MTMQTCRTVAKYFLALVDEESGDSLSNLKLQKLVYYAQGIHLALFDTALFPEQIEAWTHGPVVPELYHTYKQFGAAPLPRESVDLAAYSQQSREALDEAWTVYGQFSAAKLRNMTHDEAPWKDAYASGGGVISLESMRVYFKTQLAGA